MRKKPQEDQSASHPSGELRFYAAPCWSTEDAAHRSGTQFTIMLFGEHMPLAEGLKRMEVEGWRLTTVQPNYTADTTYTHHQHSLPVSYYLFRKADHRQPGGQTFYLL